MLRDQRGAPRHQREDPPLPPLPEDPFALPDPVEEQLRRWRTERRNPSAATVEDADYPGPVTPGYARSVERLLDFLDMELTRFGERAEAAPSDWGFAGSMTQVRNMLVDAVEHLSGVERAFIEETLSEC